MLLSCTCPCWANDSSRCTTTGTSYSRGTDRWPVAGSPAGHPPVRGRTSLVSFAVGEPLDAQRVLSERCPHRVSGTGVVPCWLDSDDSETNMARYLHRRCKRPITNVSCNWRLQTVRVHCRAATRRPSVPRSMSGLTLGQQVGTDAVFGSPAGRTRRVGDCRLTIQ